MRSLITGGVKSGKSKFALRLAEEFSEPRYFLATAEAFDDEMKARIAGHRKERAGRFTTIEEPLEIAQKLKENMILDCLPLWLNNMFHYGREAVLNEAVDSLIGNLPENIVLVTNEIGLYSRRPRFPPIRRRAGQVERPHRGSLRQGAPHGGRPSCIGQRFFEHTAWGRQK
jgi:adenosylcobinamide kinase/adenosylcobinamide-phosphate guanylyltransferase